MTHLLTSWPPLYLGQCFLYGYRQITHANHRKAIAALFLFMPAPIIAVLLLKGTTSKYLNL